MLKLVSKPKATQLVFTTQKVFLNKKKVRNILDISNVTEIRVIITEKLKTPVKNNQKQKN